MMQRLCFRYGIFALFISIHADITIPIKNAPEHTRCWYTSTPHTKSFSHYIDSLYAFISQGLQDVKEALCAIPTNIIEYLVGKNPYEKTIAYIRYTPTDDICSQEQMFLAQRTPFIRQGLQALCGNTISDFNDTTMPRIALCFSGGGFRSMLMTLGFLKGAQTTGLLDATSYMAGLSGSTWAIAPWIASKKTVSDFINGLGNNIQKGLRHINESQELKIVLSNLLAKLMHGQSISAMDIYGALLVNTILYDLDTTRLSLTLTESHQHCLNGAIPFPIYTAIKTNSFPYEWMEITPYEIGSPFLQTYIPTWAYGRKFKEGISIDNAPEQTLGYFLGIFGSAFEVNFGDLLRSTAYNLRQLRDILPSFLEQNISKIIRAILRSPFNNLRFFPSALHNFTHDAPHSPLHTNETICLVDAGIDFTLPLPPLLRKNRHIDIIIVYDASGTIFGCQQLRDLQKYADRKGIKLPPIDYEHADSKTISIFEDAQDESVPIIIYFPRIKNELYSENFDPERCIQNEQCGTLNFIYSQDQIKQLVGLAEFTVRHHAHDIATVIKNVMKRKQMLTCAS